MIKLAKNPSGTKKLAESLAKKFLSMRKAQPSPSAQGMFTPHQFFGGGQVRPCEFLKRKEKAIVIGLIGELGSGKTTFLQGFAKGLGIKEKILSPTFVIMRKYQLMTNDKRLTANDKQGIKGNRQSSVVSRQSKSYFYHFYHIDCYRIQKPKEILDLDFKEIISYPKNIVAVEWADRIKKIMPKNTIWLKFNFINKNTRQIKVRG